MTKLNLKTGNVLLFKYDNPISNIISTLTGYYSHAAIVVKSDENHIWLLEAVGTFSDDKYKNKGILSRFKFFTKIKKMFGGKVIVTAYDRDFFNVLYDNNRLQVQKYKSLNIDQMRDFVNMYQGKKYDYLSVFDIFMNKVFNKDIIKENEDKLFCSELAARFIYYCCNTDVLKTIGKDSFEKISPNDLALVYNKYRDGYSIGN